MQQVKKQLQDAIKKLKSDWGINEVKREDLAAVLDKVVAAVERAAQLPVAPVKTEFEGVVIAARKEYSGDRAPGISDGNAPLGSIPTLYGQAGSSEPQILMYDEVSRTMYRHTNNGKTAYDEYKNNLFLCAGEIIMFSRDLDGSLVPIMLSIRTDVYSH